LDIWSSLPGTKEGHLIINFVTQSIGMRRVFFSCSVVQNKCLINQKHFNMRPSTNKHKTHTHTNTHTEKGREKRRGRERERERERVDITEDTTAAIFSKYLDLKGDNHKKDEKKTGQEMRSVRDSEERRKRRGLLQAFSYDAGKEWKDTEFDES
jgi:hypothetical protein